MTYYKATRPDGTDFWTRKVDYAGHLASGTQLDPKPDTGNPECCSSTVYHAADTLSETLVGGSWPCRLFEVTGIPVAQRGHKYGFLTMRIIRELPAWQALGPNGEAVAALIERAGSLTPDEIARLDAAWSAARDAARDAAQDAARSAAWSAARYAARDAARDAGRHTARDAARDAAMDAARNTAWHATGNAAGVLVVRDLISGDHFETLYGPWRSVMEVAG